MNRVYSNSVYSEAEIPFSDFVIGKYLVLLACTESNVKKH